MQPETVLAFDTSAAQCAAALLLPNGECLVREEAMAKGQAERLIPLLDELLSDAGLSWRDLWAIGVGTGPGNFTGVRISVATARGLALSLGIPAIGVTRLEALAHGLPRPLAVIEDARRGEVYVQEFTPDPEVARVSELGALALEIGNPPLVGSAAEQAAAVTGAAILAPRFALVEAIARIAATRIGTAHPRPAPFYLRGADAMPPSDPPPVILDA